MHARGLDGWHVTVLTEEAHLPYDRVALSKALTDADVDLTLGTASMWDHEALSLRTGERVTGIDTAGKYCEGSHSVTQRCRSSAGIRPRRSSQALLSYRKPQP